MLKIRIRELIVAPFLLSDVRSFFIVAAIARSLDGDTLIGLPVADKIAIRAYEFACTSLTAPLRWVSCTPPRECLRDNEREFSRGRRIRRGAGRRFPKVIIFDWYWRSLRFNHSLRRRRRAVVGPSGSKIFLCSGNIACTKDWAIH